MGQKQNFEFTEKIDRQFLLNLFYNENLYYLLCSCTSLVFGQNLVPWLRTKMFSANQIAGVFNQPYLQNRSSNSPIFRTFLINHISGTDQSNSPIFCTLIRIPINQKLIKKDFGVPGQKWVWTVPGPKLVWSIWLQKSKIDFISRMNSLK